jgi:hypothetical protein
MQEQGDPFQVLVQVSTATIAVLLVGNIDEMLLIVDEFAGHGLDRHDVIDATGGDSAAGHALHGCSIDLGLGQGEAAMLLDDPDANRAIATDARKDDADRALAAVLG